MNEYITEIDSVTKDEWSSLLNLFDDATIYQTWSYGSVRWSESQLSHIILRYNSCIVAAAQVRLIKIPLVKKGIAYVTWGPLWMLKGHKTDIGHLRQIFNELYIEYVKKQGYLLRIRPSIIEDCAVNFHNILIKQGFKKSHVLDSYRTALLDLRPSAELLRKDLAQKWRNQLNRAEKNELTIIEGTDDRLYQIYCTLHQELLQRKTYIGEADLNEYRAIQRDLPEIHKMIILICEYKGTPLSGLVGSVIGNTGIYLLGATNKYGMKMKSSYLIQWRMIQLLKERGCIFYDLGGINPEKNAGVYHFKAGLSGKDVQHIGQYQIYSGLINKYINIAADRSLIIKYMFKKIL